MIFQHSRFQVWNKNQHPFSHALSEFYYFNPALPPGTVYNLEQAMNWLFAVIYPQTQPAVANQAALPLVGNTLNDYRVVLDDGDGKAASYRWEQREGEVNPSWHKVYDMDWGEQTILSNFLVQTQDVYVYKPGRDDLDEFGSPIVGLFAGQSVYGGASANTNLTLTANSGDGVGPRTGYVQVTDDFRPTVDNDMLLGTPLLAWKELWIGTEANIGDITISSGFITSNSGTVSFDDENIVTTGDGTFGYVLVNGNLDADDITGNHGSFDYVTATVAASSFFSGSNIGTLVLADGSITDPGGSIDFDNENLSTTGTVTSGTLTIGAGSIDDTSGSIDFGQTDFTNIKDLTATGNIKTTGGDVESSGLLLASNKLSSKAGNLLLQSFTGVTQVLDPILEVNPSGFSDVRTTQIIGWANGAHDNLGLYGVGAIYVGNRLLPTTINAFDFGEPTSRFRSLYLNDSIGNGTNQITMSTLMSLRDINVGVAVGHTIFWDGSKWVASAPDSEVDHGTITGLGDDDHTQYALLAGRAGGQTLFGSTLAAENLNLDSTSHATKGDIVAFSDFRPNSDATKDLGAAAFRFVDLYLSGEIFGITPEKATTGAPPASPIEGQMYYATDDFNLYGFRNGSWRRHSIEKFVYNDSVGWDGVATSVVYNITSEIQDCRTAIWALHDNADNHRQIFCNITKTLNQVTVSVVTPLPAGTYMLVGIN